MNKSGIITETICMKVMQRDWLWRLQNFRTPCQPQFVIPHLWVSKKYWPLPPQFFMNLCQIKRTFSYTNTPICLQESALDKLSWVELSVYVAERRHKKCGAVLCCTRCFLILSNYKILKNKRTFNTIHVDLNLNFEWKNEIIIRM